MGKKKRFSDKESSSTLNKFLPEEVRVHLKSKMMEEEISIGYLKDYVTGEPLLDTPEERVRQKIERLLVDELGYERFEIDVEKE
jgi:hypothetical protein